jgi:glycosyltransferase involved in cell wall biosynthesis
MKKTITTTESIPNEQLRQQKPFQKELKNQAYVLHVGCSGFPLGLAAIFRIRLTLKAISRSGFRTLAISKRNLLDRSHLSKVGRTDEVAYVNTSVYHKRPDSFVGRRLDQICGFLGELFLMLKKKQEIHSLIFYGSSFTELLYYRFISKVLGFKLFVQYVEYRSSFEHRNSLFLKLNDYLFDHHLSQFCDGILAISEFLKSKVRELDRNASIFKLPAICDYDNFPKEKAKVEYPYIMYCGTMYYHEIIAFIIDVFNKLKKQSNYKGKLLIFGGPHRDPYTQIIRQKIEESDYSEDIIFKGKVKTKILCSYYKSADLLLIPLRNSIQDVARFPHKIGEYTASGRPFLSTRVGEVDHYFEDYRDALLAEEYSVEAYYQKLAEVIDHPEWLDEIGKKGYQTGRKSFHYATFSEGLGRYLRECE